MDTYIATELAYKNGYEQGQKDAVKHGRWEWHNNHWECSNCRGSRFHDLVLGLDAAYCGRCGAKMEDVL